MFLFCASLVICGNSISKPATLAEVPKHMGLLSLPTKARLPALLSAGVPAHDAQKAMMSTLSDY